MKTENIKSKNQGWNIRDDISIRSTSAGKTAPGSANNMYFDFDIITNDPGIQGSELDDEQEIIWDEYKEINIFNSLQGDYVDPDDYNSE